MLRRLSLLNQLPFWARPEHPVLRFELSKRGQGNLSGWSQILRGLRILAFVLVFLAGGYYYATEGLRNAPGSNLSDGIWRTLFIPTFVIQIITRIAAIAISAGAIDEERKQQRWDSLRATAKGAELMMRTRWVSIFYRLRGLMAIMLAARIVLILGVMYDLTAFRGGYLNLLIANITPDTPVIAGILLLTMLITAAILLPLTGIGVDAALGLLIAARVESRILAVFLQTLLIIIRITMTGFFLYGMIVLDHSLFDAISGSFAHISLSGNEEAWLLVAGFAAFANWGLAFLQLGAAGEIWAAIPYSIFIGVALLLFAMFQSVLAEFLLRIAVHFAERSE